MSSITHYKVQLPFIHSNGVAEVETVWTKAGVQAHSYELDNVPFYAVGLALGDLIEAYPDEGGMLLFQRLLRASGHSTVRLWFAKDHVALVNELRDTLRALGCPSELSDLPRLVAVDIPPAVHYSEIKAKLDAWEQAGILEYEEACLAEP